MENHIRPLSKRFPFERVSKLIRHRANPETSGIFATPLLIVYLRRQNRVSATARVNRLGFTYPAAVSIRNVFTLVYYHRNNCPPFIMRISAGICEYADPTGTNAHATRRACAQTRDTHGGSFSHKPWRFTLSSGRIYPSANCCNLANVPCSPRVCVCACVYSWKLLGNETTRIHHRLIPVDRLFPSPSPYFSHNT